MTTLTPDFYWGKQPLAVAALRTMSLAERGSLAQQLAADGYTIDEAIMVDQEMLPQDVMTVRGANGFTWVPAANQPNLPSMPGDDLPGVPHYDPLHPPAGSIHVPFLASDYAQGPTKPPAPVVVPPPQPIIGEGFTLTDGTTIYLPGPGLNQNLAAEGEIVQQNGVNYVTHVDWTKRLIPIWFTVA